MPKIIENLESRLLEEARKQLFELGYGTMTIRSVAKACGVGVGTVYNYFLSKDEMIAMIMMKDLEQAMAEICRTCTGGDAVKLVLAGIYVELVNFSREHSGIFRDRVEAANFMGSFYVYREWLREQIGKILRPYCESDFSAEFIAEAMIAWTIAKKPFDEIYEMVRRVLIKPQT